MLNEKKNPMMKSYIIVYLTKDYTPLSATRQNTTLCAWQFQVSYHYD